MAAKCEDLKQRQCPGVQWSWRDWHGWTPEWTKGLMETSIPPEPIAEPSGDGLLGGACGELAGACVILRQSRLSGTLKAI